MSGRSYSDLIAWQRSIDFVCLVYRISEAFPKEERYGLTSQLRRAVVSVPANIAEGQGRTSRREFANFLSIAHGSLREVETFLIIAEKLGFITTEVKNEALDQAGEIGRLLGGLRNALMKPHSSS